MEVLFHFFRGPFYNIFTHLVPPAGLRSIESSCSRPKSPFYNEISLGRSPPPLRFRAPPPSLLVNVTSRFANFFLVGGLGISVAQSPILFHSNFFAPPLDLFTPTISAFVLQKTREKHAPTSGGKSLVYVRIFPEGPFLTKMSPVLSSPVEAGEWPFFTFTCGSFYQVTPAFFIVRR